MPKSPGCTYRSVSAVATGSTSLTITKPTGTADGDILVMFLTHKGVAYATMPAGWTVIEQNIQGSTRGEAHWKRASGEGASYAVTGLNDTACGFIASYPGCRPSGNPIGVSTSRANASGVNGCASIDTPEDNTLLVVSAHSANANSTSGFTNQNGGVSERPRDQDLASMTQFQQGGTTTGTDCHVGAGHSMKIVAGPTATLGWSQMTPENVGIAFGLLPDITTATAGTRYYLAQRPPGAYFLGALDGDWADTNAGPNADSVNQLTYALTQSKASLGSLATNLRCDCNQQGDHDVLIARFASPPLEAQTITGTFDVMLSRSAYFENGGVTNNSVVRWKVHSYVTVGQTTQVRSVLLDKYVDSVDFPFGLTKTWAALVGAQALTSQSCLAGDSVMVEIGYRIVSSPVIAPTYPPSTYTSIRLTPFGGAEAVGSAPGGVPYYADGTAGSTTVAQVPFFDFSHTFVEQALVAPPANDACATAIALTLPYQSPARIDTTQSTYSNRSVWYTYTPTEDETLILALLGSSYEGTFECYRGSCGALTFTSTFTLAPLMRSNRCQTVGMLDVTFGNTYFIRAMNRAPLTGNAAGGLAASGGGSLRVLISKRDTTPQPDDLYIPALNTVVWRDGVIVNFESSLASFAPTGIVIDYSKTPMDDLNGGVNETDRVYLALHNAEVIEILNAETLNVGESEIDFIDAPLTPAIDHVASLAIDPAGNLVIGSFGNGYLYVTGAGTLTAYLDDVSSPLTLSAVRRLPAVDGDNQPGAPFAAAESFTLDDGPASAHHIALSPNGNIAYYVTGAWYLGSAAQTIKRFDLANNVQLADFATVPVSSSPVHGLRGLCVLPDDRVLVSNGSDVVLLSAAGAVLQTMTPAEIDEATMLADVRLTSDGLHFWVVDGNSTSAWKFSLTTFLQEDYLQTFMGNGSFSQFAIFAPTVPGAVALTLNCADSVFTLTGFNFDESTVLTVTRDGIDVTPTVLTVSSTVITFTLAGVDLTVEAEYCATVTNGTSFPSTVCASFICEVGCPLVTDPPPVPPTPSDCPVVIDADLVFATLTTNDGDDIVTSDGLTIIVLTPEEP